MTVDQSMMSQNRTCQGCDRSLGPAETGWIWNEYPVCTVCYGALTADETQAGTATPADSLTCADHAGLLAAAPLLTTEQAALLERWIMIDGPGAEEIRAEIQQALSADAAAFNLLGVRFYHGRVIPKALRWAAQFFARGARMGNCQAFHNLGTCYTAAAGPAPAASARFTLFQKRADAGDPDAMYWLGFCWAHGVGTKRHHPTAAECYRRAAESGHAHAWVSLGLLFHTGNGVAQSDKAALDCFQKAAAMGHPPGMYQAGCLYMLGQGLEENPGAAAAWFTKAAASGHDLAMNLLGNCYGRGYGVPRDPQAAHYWRRLALEVKQRQTA